MTDKYERIVRALAAVEDPSVEDRDYAPSSECGLCDAPDEGEYKHWLNDPLKHNESCPWRMAKLLIAHLDGPACDHCHHEVDHYAWCPNAQVDGGER